jgi:hypothetical protein
MVGLVDDDVVPGINAMDFVQALGGEGLDGAKDMIHRVRAQAIDEESAEIAVFEHLAEAAEGLFEDFLAVGDEEELGVAPFSRSLR